MEKIFDEIKAERSRQDEQWGGTEHDDGHGAWDWMLFIRHQIRRYTFSKNQIPEHGDRIKAIRSRLVKIAALAVAGIESIDRKSP